MTLLHRYIHKMHTSGSCNANCKAGTLCDLLTTRPDDPEACKDILTKGVSMKDVYDHWAMNQRC